MNARENYSAARQAWLAAIAARRDHYTVSRYWDAVREAAKPLGIVPGVHTHPTAQNWEGKPVEAKCFAAHPAGE